MGNNIGPDALGIRLTTYAELEMFVTGFARGDLKLLILLGSHGLGKSQTLRRAMAGQVCWLEGNASAFGLYCQLWRHQNQAIVLDDLDGLYANRDGIRLLKSLTQTEPQKTVSWYTDAATLQREQIPQEFRTSSRVAIITNEWKTLNRNVAALQDRGHLVIFEPTPEEVHTRTAAWFWDQEIYDFVGERLHLFAEASMRHYVAASELKQAGLDWRGLLLSRCLSGKALLVAQLKANPSYGSETERLKAFVAKGGGSRATYYHLCKTLRAPLPSAPSIRLQRQAPPRPMSDPETLRILRKWRGDLSSN
jgi:hypothetical protein